MSNNRILFSFILAFISILLFFFLKTSYSNKVSQEKVSNLLENLNENINPTIEIINSSKKGSNNIEVFINPVEGYLNVGDVIAIQKIDEKGKIISQDDHHIYSINIFDENLAKLFLSPNLLYNLKKTDKIEKKYYPVKRIGGDTWKESNQFDITRQRDCPKNKNVIVIIGQSNAANSLEIENNGQTKHLNFFEGKCFILTDEVLGSTSVSGKNHYSIALPIAEKLKSKNEIIFLVNGVSGSSIKDWADPTFISKYTNKEILKLQDLNNNIRIIIWIQGEADRHTDIDYKKYFLIMRDNILNNYKNKKQVNFIVTQTSICGNQKRDNKLNNQQLLLAEEENINTLNITDNLDQTHRYDLCHFNKKGSKVIAKVLADEINKILK